MEHYGILVCSVLAGVVIWQLIKYVWKRRREGSGN
jgi:hypothetical protein